MLNRKTSLYPIEDESLITVFSALNEGSNCIALHQLAVFFIFDLHMGASPPSPLLHSYTQIKKFKSTYQYIHWSDTSVVDNRTLLISTQRLNTATPSEVSIA